MPSDTKLNAAVEKFRKETEGRPVIGVKGPVVPWVGNYKPPTKEQWVSEPVGLGGWDYTVANATDQKGPNNEKLPVGAKAWDKFGRPYYGAGAAGFAKAAYFKATEEAKRLEERRKQGAYIPHAIIGIRSLGAGVLDALGVLMGPAQTVEQGLGTAAGLQEAGTQLGATLPESSPMGTPIPEATGTGAQVLTNILEQFPGIGPAFKAIVDSSSKPPIIEQSVGSYLARTSARMENITSFIQNLSFGNILYNDIRIATAPGALQEKYDAIKAQWEAGSILYTALLEPAAKAEFLRRAQSGEDAGLLALELQNPSAEFVGQSILDPLNLWGAAGKGARRTADLRGSTSVFANPSEEIKAALTALKAGDPKEAIQSLTRLVDAANTAKATQIGERATDIGLTALTASGKRAALVDTSMTLVQRFATDVKDPDTLIELMQALILKGSDDIGEVREGVARLVAISEKNPVSLNIVFSEAGDELVFALRKAIGDDAVKFYDDVARIASESGVEGVLAHSESKFAGAAEELFPDVATRIANGEDVGRVAKALNKIDKGILRGPFRVLNTFYSHIYMGMSPGYAFRNAIQNTFHVFIDEGLHNPFSFEAHNALGEAWQGGTKSRAALRQIRTPMSGEVAGKAKGALKSMTEFASELANKFEGTAAKSVVGLSIDRNMRKMAPRALADAAPILREAGMADDQIRALEHLIIQNHGDVAAALDTVGTRVEAFRILGKHSPEEAKSLQGFGTLLQDIEDILNSGLGRGESQSAIMALADEVDNIAADVLKEVPGVARDADGFADAVVYTTLTNDEGLKGSFNALIQANNNSMDATILSADQTLRKLSNPTVLGRLPPERVSQAQNIIARYGKLVDPETRALVKGFVRKSGDDYMKIMDELVSIRGQQLTPEATAKYWDLFGMEGAPPAGMAAQELLNESFWWFRESKRRFYAQIRDVSFRQASDLTNEATQFAQSVGMQLDNTLYDTANILRNQAEVYQDAFTLKEGLHYIPELKPFKFSVGDAEILRLPQTGDIRSSRKLLDAINEYNQEGKVFESLKDVSLETAERALANREADIANATLRAGQRAPSLLDEVQKTFAAPETFKIGGERPGDLERLLKLHIENPNMRGWESLQIQEAIKNLPEEVKAGRTYEQIMNDLLDEVGKTGATPNIVPLAPPYDGGAPSLARVAEESKAGVRQTLERITANMDGVAGESIEVGMDPKLRDAYELAAGKNMQEARIVTMDVAAKERDFALHDYRARRNFDQALGYIYPYQFWYSRTYAKWAQRIADQPNLLATYLRYKDYMGKIHAGAPDWWKYNINTNELLGLNSENPLYFNLEAMLNPLYGVAGVDFNDPYKRINWFTTTLDNMSKFGPSVHSIYSLATAIGLYASGEKDAASRWAGRLFPQTGSLIKPATALALGNPIEVDPWVQLFSGGLDPYERRRVQRGLSAMVNEGIIGEADAIDAARLQTGPVWDEAVLRATQERAPGQLSSFLLGAGFKARSTSDIQIDKFYNDWYRLWEMEPNLSPDELQGAMNELRTAYPFMDTLLLSRKGGVDRDRNYVYNVLGRIPPSMSDDIAKAAGIDPEMLSQFYDQKGHIEAWPETDQIKFMAGIVDIAAILDLPDGATRDTWLAAKSAYKEVQKLGEKNFGPDIWDMTATYFAKRGDTPESIADANAFLEAHPIVSQALDWQAQTIMFSPTLSAYYTSLDKINGYYSGQMYAAIERELGSDIWDKWDEYWSKAEVSAADAKAYKKQHPELARYGEIKDEWEQTIIDSTLNVAGLIQSGPGPSLRDIQGELSQGEQGVQQLVQQPRDILPSLSLDQWDTMLGSPLLRLILDNEDLPGAAQNKLDDLAEQLGLPSGGYIPELILKKAEQEVNQ